jgi:hypothetical protein
MALQIRRGTDTQRQALSGPNTPIAGELLYSTDNKKLHIGDGTTTGGTSIGYFGSVAVSGQSTIRSTGTNETLTVVAGANISLVTDANTGTLTIAAAPQELTNGSLRLFQNNITSLNSNEDINIDPAGTGKVNVTGNLTATSLTSNLTGNVTGDVTGIVTATAGSSLVGNVTGNVTGNAGSVTNGVYITDTGTVTNTMLAGNIANAKLVNSSLTIGSTAVSLGSTSTTINGLTSLTSTTLNSTDLNVTGVFSNQNISIDENRIRSLNSNQSIFLDPAGTGLVNINANLITAGIQIFGPGASGASGDGSILVATSDQTALPLNVLQVHTTATPTGGVSFSRARGSLVGLATVQNSDTLNQLLFSGHDGTAFRLSSGIRATVDGTISSGFVPGKIDILTTNDSSGTLVSRMSVSSTAVTSTVPIKLAVYADATARDAAITSPSAGMMIFLTAGTKFQGYTGSAWVDLN